MTLPRRFHAETGTVLNTLCPAFAQSLSGKGNKAARASRLWDISLSVVGL